MAGDDESLLLIIAGGEQPRLARNELPTASFVVAADSGYDHAIMLGLTVDLLVGDLDSISRAGLEHAESSGVEIERHPAAKDQTDLEIALTAAVDRGPARIVVVGAIGGRLDHQLANIALLAGRSVSGRPIELWTAEERVLFATPGQAIVLPGVIGTTVSLLALGGEAGGVTTVGFQWTLDDAVLYPFETLGVSNVVAAAEATVEIAAGVVAVVVNLAAA